MAITKTIPELWSARLIQAFNNTSVYRSAVATDVSSEATEGNKVHFGTLTSAVTVKDYTRNTDIADPELASDSEQILEIDNQKYFHIYMDDIDRVQTKPAIMDQFAADAMQAVADHVDGHFYAKVKETFTRASDKTVIGATTTATYAEKFIDGLAAVNTKFARANVPAGTGRYCVMSPETKEELVKYLVKKGNTIGNLNETALRNGEVGNLMGFTMFVSNQNNAADKYPAICGLRRNIFYAGQISKVEVYRPEKRFGDAIKGLYVYGSEVMTPTFAHALVTA